jgi:hypothetical protein
MTRTRTRSDVKWLINQVAALAGELERIDVEMARFKQRRKALERSHKACLQTLSVLSHNL